jgi:hypothetical protein
MIAAHEPFVLVDLPAGRPGSDVPLYFVREASRRELRLRPRAIGDIEESKVWDVFATQMREQTGKLRIFAHPDAVAILEAAIDRDLMAALLHRALDSVDS